MERDSLKRSDEEADNLARSTKKFKESHQLEGDQGSKPHARIGSYRDKLVGCIPGAFERAFGFNSEMQEDIESDVEDDDAQADGLRVRFSREEKTRMRAPWYQGLIIKPFGSKVGYNYLVSKLRGMWNPKGGMDCIDLGFDFFLIKFELSEDVDYILKGGPWFIGQNFLTIRQWEPEFQASSATLSSIAVWVRLPELPIEFYEHNALLKIGRAIGPVLRIDANTANGVRGRFARLCVQVNLDKPLEKTIYLGKLKQVIQYEGIGTLCFACGRIGHYREACPFVVREYPTNSQGSSENNGQVAQSPGAGNHEMEKNAREQKEDYGEWMLVARRKSANRGREKPSGSKGSQMGESSNSGYEKIGASTSDSGRVAVKRKASGAQQSNQHIRDDGKSIFVKENHSNVRQKEVGLVDSCKKPMGLVSEGACFTFGANSSPIKINGPYMSPEGAVEGTRPSYKPGSVSKEKEGISQSGCKYGESKKLGNVLQKQNNTNRRRNYQVDQARPNGNLGMVRLGTDAGLEESFSVDGGEQRAGVPAFIEHGMGGDTKSVVEVCDGQTSPTTTSSSKLNLVKDKFRGATLGKITVRNGKGDDADGDCREEGPYGQSSGVRHVREPEHGEDDPLCGNKVSGYLPSQDVCGGEGYYPSLGNSVPRDAEEQGGGDGGMEVEEH
nr:uncharacterized protein CFP56_61118 [Quercus suber]